MRRKVGEFRYLSVEFRQGLVNSDGLKKGLVNSDTFRTNSEDLKSFGRIQTPFGRITRPQKVVKTKDKLSMFSHKKNQDAALPSFCYFAYEKYEKLNFCQK